MRLAPLALVVLVAAPVLAQDEEKKEEPQDKDEAKLLRKARRLAEDGEKEEAFKLFDQLASQAQQKSHTDTAITALEEARPCAPTPEDELRVCRSLGSLCMERGDHSRCVKAYRRAAKLAPEDAKVMNSFGYALHLVGNEDESLEAFEKCIALDPDCYEASYSLGLAYRLTGHAKKALRTHQKLADAAKEGKLTIGWYFSWESKQMKKETSQTGANLASAGSRTAVCELEVAVDHAFNDDLEAAEDAISKLKEGTAKDDLDPALQVVLDETLRAREIRPQHLQLRYLVALLWDAKGEPEKAKAELEKFSETEKKIRPFVKKAREKLGEK